MEKLQLPLLRPNIVNIFVMHDMFPIYLSGKKKKHARFHVKTLKNPSLQLQNQKVTLQRRRRRKYESL